MPNGPHKITGLPIEPELYESEHSVTDPELKTLLNSSANPKAAKKKKKKSESGTAEGVLPVPMEVEIPAWSAYKNRPYQLFFIAFFLCNCNSRLHQVCPLSPALKVILSLLSFFNSETGGVNVI